MTIYCSYLTTYSGDKLPPFYIGSTSIININSGYHGSVKSKKYKEIWKTEIKNNPHLFKTKIITEHLCRIDATARELSFQISLKVVKSPMYINESLATINGFFGMSNKGIPKSEETKQKMRGNTNATGNKGKPKSEKHKEAISEASKGKPKSEKQKQNQSESMQGVGCKNYILTDPNGVEYNITGLKDFCKQHNLIPSHIGSVASGRYLHHKNWTAIIQS